VQLVREALSFFRGQRRTLAMLGIISIVAAQIEAIGLILVTASIGRFAGGSTNEQLHVGPLGLTISAGGLMLGAVIAILVAAALTAIFVVVQSRAAAQVERSFRDSIVHSFASADWVAQSSQRTGRLTGQLRLAAAAPQAYNGLTIWLRSSCTVLVFLLMAMIVDPTASLVTITVGLGLGALVRPLRSRLRRVVEAVTEVELSFAQDFGESAEFAADLRVFRAWSRMTAKLDRVSATILALRARVHMLASAIPLAWQYGGPLLIIAVLAGLPIVSGGVPLGQLAAVALLLLRGVQYAQQLQQALQMMTESVTMLDALEREVATSKGRPAITTGVALEGVAVLEMSDVTYSYPGAKAPALQHVNLELRTGNIVGVVGPSGSGKSTLVQILLRLRLPDGGTLLANGRPANEFSENSWYARVSLVPQQTRLFHGTVHDNITFLDPTISRNDVTSAAQLLGLHEFIMSLPDGYETSVGPATRNFSGGQVQRVGIARALVRNPDVIVLDEPTSALDATSETLVSDTLAGLRVDHDLLLVVVAHRLSTLSQCDQILAMNGGAIEAFGTPSEVLESSPFFRNAFHSSALRI
jgi:ATP-binding cassette, subfamily B, bacterial